MTCKSLQICDMPSTIIISASGSEQSRHNMMAQVKLEKKNQRQGIKRWLAQQRVKYSTFISVVELFQMSSISNSNLWLAVENIKSSFQVPITSFKSLKGSFLTVWNMQCLTKLTEIKLG